MNQSVCSGRRVGSSARQQDPCAIGVGAGAAAAAAAASASRRRVPMLRCSSNANAAQTFAWPRPAQRSARLVCRASSQKQQQGSSSSSSSKKLPPGLFTAPIKQQQQRPGGGGGGNDEDDDDEQRRRWRFLDPKAYDRPWSVPWGAGAAAGTMAAWVATFGLTAFFAAPASYVALHGGTPLSELTPSGQADFALWSELLELAATAALLWAVVERNGGAGAAREQRLFDFSPSAPFRRPDGWLAWGLAGTVAAPVVVGAAAALLSAVGYEAVAAGGRGTVDGVAGMLALDLPTYLRLVAVTGVLAPLLEETLFRGFLLPSLTKFMPTSAAIFASSLAFGVAHLSIRDLPVLTALGCLLGAVYVRSRSLLAPMMVHGLWNSTVLTLLFALTASGVDVQQLLKDGAL